MLPVQKDLLFCYLSKRTYYFVTCPEEPTILLPVHDGIYQVFPVQSGIYQLLPAYDFLELPGKPSRPH